MEQYLKLELTKNFKVIRDLELMPTMLGQGSLPAFPSAPDFSRSANLKPVLCRFGTDWSSVFLQRFDGSVTIWPRTRVQDWFRLLTDPDRKELKRMLRVGEVATFPKVSRRVLASFFPFSRQVEDAKPYLLFLAASHDLESGSNRTRNPSRPPRRPLSSQSRTNFQRHRCRQIPRSSRHQQPTSSTLPIHRKRCRTRIPTRLSQVRPRQESRTSSPSSRQSEARLHRRCYRPGIERT